MDGSKQNLKIFFAIFGCSHPNRKVPKSGLSCGCDSAALASGVDLLNHVKATFYTERLQTRRAAPCPPITSQSATPEATGRGEKVVHHHRLADQGQCRGGRPGKRLQSSVHLGQAPSRRWSGRPLSCFCVLVSP